MALGVILLFLLNAPQSMSTGGLDGKFRQSGDYSEKLLIRPLQDGTLSASFQFDTIFARDIESLFLGKWSDVRRRRGGRGIKINSEYKRVSRILYLNILWLSNQLSFYLSRLMRPILKRTNSIFFLSHLENSSAKTSSKSYDLAWHGDIGNLINGAIHFVTNQMEANYTLYSVIWIWSEFLSDQSRAFSAH